MIMMIDSDDGDHYHDYDGDNDVDYEDRDDYDNDDEDYEKRPAIDDGLGREGQRGETVTGGNLEPESFCNRNIWSVDAKMMQGSFRTKQWADSKSKNVLVHLSAKAESVPWAQQEPQ